MTTYCSVPPRPPDTPPAANGTVPITAACSYSFVKGDYPRGAWYAEFGVKARPPGPNQSLQRIGALSLLPTWSPVCGAPSAELCVSRQEVNVFYMVIKDSRWFKPQVLYDQVDWTSLDAIVDAFADRVSEWYLKPGEALRVASGHFAFGAMALNCILIDTLSQFYAGSVASSRNAFKDFVREWFPDFRPNLPTPINHYDAAKAKNNLVPMVDFADVLYHAFRCGIVHEAHVAPYGMVRGGATVVEFQPAGYTKYAASGADCPTVLLDPWLLLDQVKTALAGYVANLKNRDPKFDQLRDRFKHKFTESFGVDIKGAT